MNKIKKSDITPELIFDIYDIVRKFGYTDDIEQTISFKSGNLGGIEFYISTSSIPGNNNLIISKSSIASGMEIFDMDDHFIMWDKKLSIDEIKDAIKRIDEIAKDLNLIDKDGKRKQMNHNELQNETKKYKYIVDEVFKSDGQVFYAPQVKNSEEILSQFDHPEKLVVLIAPDGAIVHLKSSISYINKRQDIVMELLKEKGLSIEGINDMSVDEILKLREKITKRIKEENINKI